jgi:hypothetical protein
MADRATLEARLEALLQVRDQGVLTVEFGDKRITYRSGAELAQAIADLERRIAQHDRPAVTDILIASTKGLR